MYVGEWVLCDICPIYIYIRMNIDIFFVLDDFDADYYVVRIVLFGFID